MDGYELLNKWQDKNKVWHFEGNTRNLTKLVNVLGYRDGGFGSAVTEFLNDNPGAQLAIVEWIGEWVDRNHDWKEMLAGEVGEEEDDGE
jgi:hypothetical protein